MKIMIVSDLAPPYIGGGESYVIHLGSGLSKLGHEVYWLTSKIHDSKPYEIYQGINIFRVPIPFSKNYFFPGRQFFAITSLLPAIKIAKKVDVLQFNTFIAGIFGWLVGKLTNKPTVLLCHEMFNGLWKKVGQNIFEKSIYPLVEKFIAHMPYEHYIVPSEYSKKTLIKAGAPKEKITVIPHGIDFDLFHPKVSGKKLREKYGLEGENLIGFTGRLSVGGTGQSKNLILLLKSMEHIIKVMPNSRLVFGGSGFEELQNHISNDIKNAVLYLGKRPYKEVPNFLAMCDLIVCPALADGFCFLLAEASACGKPVVATNLASHLERIIPGKTGLLVNATPKDLANGILKILTNKKLMKQMGSNGAKYTKRFKWESSIKKHLEIYIKLAKH